MPRKTHRAQFQYPPRTVLVDGVTETVARGVAQEQSQLNKNRAVVVLSEDGTVKARFLNGRDIS